ncbi:MAG TPA: heparinase II/III family protein [Candidatus Ozemobacteraceae bacterium]|nr:heparinase II/III family protein [Candidatus Ozemobacteraceae bacterium]HQG28657.1 heparinase II/III family protein [Candidatus Ozemobacteraceae bacterium]
MPEFVSRLRRLVWTAVHLKPVQIWGRLVWAARRRFKRIPGLADLAAEAARLRDARGKPSRARVAFRFLSEPREYPVDAVAWDPEGSAGFGNGVPVKLWRYNLQYFDWLNHGEIASDPETASYLILDWIARCADDGAEPWEPYPVSRRLMSWLAWLRRTSSAATDASFMALVRGSVEAQACRLETDLEIHIQANHLLMNRLALVETDAWLIETADGAAAAPLRRRLSRHAAALRREIVAQVLPDGGHEERSPMYHREMLDGIARIAATVRKLAATSDGGEAVEACRSLVARCDEVLPRMRDWLDALTHPDGRIALFHDSAMEHGAHMNIKEYHSWLATWLPDSGYFVLRRPGGLYLAVCAHAPSPRHQPGHAHCDIGSFELSLRGRRLIVDTGTGSYQDPEIRRLCRSTGAHNVPMTEGCEQSDMWGDFRVGKRAYVMKNECLERTFRLQWRDMNEDIFIRQIDWGDSWLRIRDIRHVGYADGRFVSLLHLAPGMRPVPGERILIEADGRPFCTISTGCRVEIEASMYYPEFGPGIASHRLRFISEKGGWIEYEISE